jgi:hypothetical protein
MLCENPVLRFAWFVAYCMVCGLLQEPAFFAGVCLFVCLFVCMLREHACAGVQSEICNR